MDVDPGFSVDDGNGGNNYTVTTIQATGGVILPRPVTVSAPDGIDKPFDGTTSVPTAYQPIVSGGIGEALQSAVLAYLTPDVGTGKTVRVADVVFDDGNGGRNYQVSAIDSTTGAIRGTISAEPLVSTTIPPTLSQVQNMQPVAPLETAVSIAVSASSDPGAAFIRLSDIRSLLPQLTAITGITAPAGTELPAGSRFDALEGRMYFGSNENLPTHLFATAIDHDGKLRKVKVQMIR